MNHTVPPWPLDVTSEEHEAGFRRMALSLGNFVGAFPGENVEVVARRLSDCDVLIKGRSTTRRGETKVYYGHLRYGYPNASEKIRIIWTAIRFGFWRSWLRGHLGFGLDWQHVPHGIYEHPSDGCSRTMPWTRIVGVVFHEYAV